MSTPNPGTSDTSQITELAATTLSSKVKKDTKSIMRALTDAKVKEKKLSEYCANSPALANITIIKTTILESNLATTLARLTEVKLSGEDSAQDIAAHIGLYIDQLAKNRTTAPLGTQYTGRLAPMKNELNEIENQKRGAISELKNLISEKDKKLDEINKLFEKPNVSEKEIADQLKALNMLSNDIRSKLSKLTEKLALLEQNEKTLAYKLNTLSHEVTAAAAVAGISIQKPSTPAPGAATPTQSQQSQS